MANTFLDVKEIARQTLPRLIENLVFPNLVYKDFSDDFEVGKGATVQVRKPVVLTATTFSEQSGVQVQNVTETSVDVTLDTLATVDVEFGAMARATSVDSLNRLFLEPAAAALAEKINADGMKLYKDIPYTVGTPHTTPSGLETFAEASKVLDNNKVPQVGRRGIWDPDSMAEFRKAGDLVNVEKSGTTEALRRGSIGVIFGIENYMSQSIPTHTSGDLSAGEGSLKVKTAVTDSGTVQINGTATATGSVVKGDILKIGNKNYVVTANATASSGTISVKVYPNITASQNEGVTLVPSSGSPTYKNNLVFHENAFAFVTRPLIAPAGVESYTTSYNGVSLRVTRGYDMKYKKEMLSMDVLYGYKTMYPELACRVLG